MDAVREILKVMHTDEQFVMWLQGLSPKTKVGNPRLAENCPELRFLRALGINVLLVGVHEITTLDHERIQCRWIEEFHKNLLAKFFCEGAHRSSSAAMMFKLPSTATTSLNWWPLMMCGNTAK